VIGTAAGSAGMTIGQGIYLRRELHGRLDGRQTLATVIAMTGAAMLMGVVAYLVWLALDALLGRSLPAQIVTVGGGIGAGLALYAYAVHHMHIPEARQIHERVSAHLARLRG
jgi:putative peptidoglycan lipid II flippase